MSWSLHFLPEVEDDVLGARSWYEAKSAGLGQDFLRAFFSGSQELHRHPLLYAKTHRAFRRHLLRRFPYALYFFIEHDRVIVAGLFHCARDPMTISAQLRGRTVRVHPSR